MFDTRLIFESETPGTATTTGPVRVHRVAQTRTCRCENGLSYRTCGHGPVDEVVWEVTIRRVLPDGRLSAGFDSREFSTRRDALGCASRLVAGGTLY